MFTRTIFLKDTKEIIEGNNVFRDFLRCVYEKYEFGVNKFDLLIKKGENYNFKGLEMMVLPLNSDEHKKISRINYSEFAKDALNEIDSYRLVKDELYKICPSDNQNIVDGKEYLFSINWNPEFRISASKVTGPYKFDLIKFQSFNKKEFLNYIPQNKYFPERLPNEILIEAKLKKDGILYKTYKKILEHHKVN